METREIKFRSAHYNFDGTFSHFSYWGMIDHKGEKSTDCFTSPSSASGTTRKHEEQFTGLKDKNGTEIYEGDIIDWEGDTGYVVFHETSWKIKIVNLETLQHFFIESTKIFEIIGNIHQNHELLK